jgi:hypothetical protein
MQLNIHVPRDREGVVVQLENEAQTTGRAKNQIVLDALAAYLAPRPGARRPRLRSWRLEVRDDLHRADIYDDRLVGRHDGSGA